MGFFDLFKKKSEKLTEEQVDEIEEKVEGSEEKHVQDKAIFSDLKKPTQTKVKKAVKKSSAKRAKSSSGKKVKKGSKTKSKKRR